MSQFFASGSQSIGVSASASVLPIDWFDLLAIQGTLRSLSQYHSTKASILWYSVFLMVQLSHPYYWKNHSFEYMVFNMLLAY